jgi:hypothetical protein
MKDQWLKQCIELSKTPADFYSGCRKILRNVTFEVDLDNDLTIEDCGFTRNKLAMLRRLYYVEDSIAAAVTQWERCKARDKYSSASFHCYGHFLKSDPEKKSKRASVMGPCIQAVTLTYLKRGQYTIDAFYRTTELLKKFPADLVFLRQILAERFELHGGAINVRYHFANVTVHPMYFVTIMPLIRQMSGWTAKVTEASAIKSTLNHIKDADRRFYDWVVKWTARYLCPENMRGIAKFAQAMRVRQDAMNRITGDTLTSVQEYLRANHPGYRNDYQGDDDEDE